MMPLRPNRRLAACALAALAALAAAAAPEGARANTIVRVSTSIGDFSMELLDDAAPLTVRNFLNYVNRDDYNGTYLHRVVDGFVAQGGGFFFVPFAGVFGVPTDPPVVNEFGASNVRGTVAMAKVAGDPDSATSQWFVNLDDNSANLDNANGGFTVFGRVLGEGMTLLDAIDDLPTVSLGSVAAPSTPYFTPAYDNDPRNFVHINMEVVDRFSSAPHVYEGRSGLMITSVSVDGGDRPVSLNLSAVATSPELVLKANLKSVIPRRDGFPGIATFAPADGRLRIPTLEVNGGDDVFLVSDVVFVLSDPDEAEFTLESYRR